MAQREAIPSTAVASGVEGHASAYMWVVLFASLLVQTTASFGNQAISPLAPFLLADLGLSKAELGLVVAAFYLGASLMLTSPAGPERSARRAAAVPARDAAGVGLPLVLASQVRAAAAALGTDAALRVGNGFALPPTTRAITYWFPTRLRGIAMGIKQTGVALAGVIMGLVVPPLGPSRSAGAARCSGSAG